MRVRTNPRVLLGLALAAILPVATDGGQAQCCNVTGSLASTAAGPVNGDEAFFKLPTGPANVMFLLDVSGSMNEFPQCGDYAWDDGSAPTSCKSPANLPAPTNSTNRAVTFTYTGTCTPSSYTTPSGTTSPLYWMEQVTPQTAYADPGRTNALLTDRPPWGNGCTGNACLFDPTATYLYDDWGANATAAGNAATRRALDVPAGGLPVTCTALDGNGAPIKDYNNANIVLGSDCTSCMANHGFFIYRLSKYTSLSGNTPNGWKTYTPNASQASSQSPPLFKGTFLNANPPKFVAARKVVKDVAWMDPAAPRKLDNVRLGLAILDSNGTYPAKARLTVPLGPDKTSAYPPTQANFVQARQYLLSVINYDQATYGTTVGTTLTGGFFNPILTNTPLGSALLNVGQYFTSLNRYNQLLGSGFQTSLFNESSAGDSNAAWARSNPNQCSICWGCQNNSVVIVTDGSPNNEISPFPSTVSNYDAAGYTAAGNCGTSGTLCGSSVLPRVADWLHNQDLRTDAVMSGNQKVTVHTVGINITATTAVRILQSTANLGGGIFQNVSDPAALGNAVYNAINQVIPKEDSYTAANTSSLLTVRTQAAEAFLSRFKPNQTPTWEGHVYQTFLFDETLQGCDPTKAIQPQVTCGTRTISADYDGDGTCNGLFTVDLDCDEVTEDANTGSFMKKGQNAPANLPWDAGLVLSDPTKTGYRSADETAANARNIFTYVNGAKVQFTAANAATLLPYLNISLAWCNSFLTQLGITPTAGQETLTCAQQIIYFVRGWDTLNQDQDSCWGPGNSKNLSTCPSGTKGEERNRANDGSSSPFFWKLGDIFHSASAVVQAPSDEIRCDTGHDKQCVSTLHSPSILPNQTTIQMYSGSGSTQVDAYERYRLDQIGRERVLIVGANDGMLHGFDAGHPDFSGGPDVTGSYPYTYGTGEELWAFIPPDLLPRLKDLTTAHQYMVDAPVMVRDVWVDANHDHVKTRDEFRTVAIVGRRSGGTAYSALDVTNPTAPVVLWTFPQPCSDDARWMGESWTEIGSKAPPIVPVRLSTGGSGFEERWIVMINGGYDPMLAKGRAVFMLDVWTGATLWRWTDDDFKSKYAYGNGTSMFPVTAAIAMMDIGDPATQRLDQDGFFDTATWGDLGGNLWVARFWQPGVIDANSGRVGNWFAARAFEQRRRSDDLQNVVGRNEFYEITSNGWHAPTHTLRTLLGSGNREQLMATNSTCGTDNVLGCCQAGCSTVTATSANNYGSCNGTTTFSCASDMMTFVTTTTASCSGTAQCAASPANAYTTNLSISATCPGYGSGSASGSASFDANGLGTVNAMPVLSATSTQFRAPSHNRFYGVWAFGGDPKKMFGGPSDDATTAKTFDKNRFTDVTFAGCSGPTGGSCKLIETTYASASLDSVATTQMNVTCGGAGPCSATESDPGWFYEYGQNCPLETCPTSPPWTDEKTSGNAEITGTGCVLWNSFRPVGATTSTDPCTGSLGVPASYGYQVDAVSGTANPIACGTLLSPPPGGGGSSGGGTGSQYGTPGVRQPIAASRASSAAPQSPDSFITVTCASGGNIGEGTTTWSDSKVTKSVQQTKSCAAQSIYWLEVPRDVHTCRHVDPTTCE